MVASAYLLLMALGQAPTDQLQVLPNRVAIELTWADAEDRVQGSIRPPEPRARNPLEVSVHVGTFQGNPFDGPVTLTLRKSGERQGEEHTVARGKVSWNATFVPPDEGAYVLDVAFRSTRLKVTHAPVEVAAAKLSRLPWWLLLGAALATAFTLGVRAATRKPPPPAPPPE